MSCAFSAAYYIIWRSDREANSKSLIKHLESICCWLHPLLTKLDDKTLLNPNPRCPGWCCWWSMWWSHGEEDQRIVQMISLTGRLAGQPKDNNNKKDKYKDKDNHNNKLLKFYYSQVSWLASPFCEALQYNAPVPLFQPKRNSHRKSFPRKKYVSDRIFENSFWFFKACGRQVHCLHIHVSTKKYSIADFLETGQNYFQRTKLKWCLFCFREECISIGQIWMT